MKTLCIHPNDPTTTMLNVIYEDKDWDIINDTSITKEELKEKMKDYDRIIMLGHGTPSGLMRPGGNWELGVYMVDSSFAEVLREKETISIWCNSDKFFEREGIEGFHTGMIISEVGEEHWVLGHAPLDEQQIYENMILFSECVRDCIDNGDANYMRKYILDHYVGDDEVTQYNRKNVKVL